MSQRGGQVPWQVALAGHGEGCGCYSKCNRKLLEVSKLKSNETGLMF